MGYILARKILLVIKVNSQECVDLEQKTLKQS